MRYNPFKAIKEEFSKIVSVVLLYSKDLSRLNETALDNNKNKLEYIVIWLQRIELYQKYSLEFL
jgi:hypothetical protein